MTSSAPPAAPDSAAGETAPAVPANPPSPSARVAPGAIAIRLACAAAIVLADLWSKASVFAWLDRLHLQGRLVNDPHNHPRLPLIDGWFTFMESRNPGAAFGQLESFPWLLVVGRSGAAVFLVWLLARTPRGRPWFTAALVLVLGGALGNLYDNLFLREPHTGHPFGLVRDFIDVYFSGFDWHFPTFNVADSCITVGAVLLLLSSLRSEK
jgi:signal peptidase II